MLTLIRNVQVNTIIRHIKEFDPVWFEVWRKPDAMVENFEPYLFGYVTVLANSQGGFRLVSLKRIGDNIGQDKLKMNYFDSKVYYYPEDIINSIKQQPFFF